MVWLFGFTVGEWIVIKLRHEPSEYLERFHAKFVSISCRDGSRFCFNDFEKREWFRWLLYCRWTAVKMKTYRAYCVFKHVLTEVLVPVFVYDSTIIIFGQKLWILFLNLSTHGTETIVIGNELVFMLVL